MPATLGAAINFLETQWSSINDNKIKGILAELRFKSFLIENNHHFVSGGWIVTPGNASIIRVPPREKICILPRSHGFSWMPGAAENSAVTAAEISAYNYFRQVGVRAFFSRPVGVDENAFVLPSAAVRQVRASYPAPYQLEFLEMAPRGDLMSVTIASALQNFPRRNGNIGMRCYPTQRIDPTQTPWTTPSVVSDLFWFEYSRYYLQRTFLLSNNDLDLFVIGPSGQSFPVELKSKMPAPDTSLGDWFGIDMGPFAKLSFFTANGMNTDALYVVEEVDEERNHLEWYAIRFTELVKTCSWVGQGGGTGMMGGASSTYKIPKAAFSLLTNLVQAL